MILKNLANMLRGLFQANAKPQRDEAAELAKRLEERVLALVGNMPTLPDTATRAMAMANDANTKIPDFARLIEGDAAIATGLLRIANSAFYTGGSPAVKLHQAVVRLGMFQCKNLILSIGMKSMIWQMAGEEKAQCEALWRHGYVTGSLCRQINRAYRLGFDGEEFSAGLLHDLGRILIVLADPECFERIGALDFREEGDVLGREQAAIGIDHCALGGWFGDHSKLPEALIDSMRFHHQPNVYENSLRLVVLVAAADHMANHVQRGEDPAAYRPEENAALTPMCERWPEARKQRLLGEIPALMNDAVQAAATEQAGV